MARKGQQLILTDEDLTTLTATARALSIDHRSVVRAKIILMLHQGYSYDMVKAELKVGREAIAKWKKRFIQYGIEGLHDAPRSGKPPIYTEADKARVVQKACTKPEGGYTNWSQRRIAKALGMSQSTVQGMSRPKIGLH